MIVLLSLVTTKHEALGVTVWSKGSPSCLRWRPAGVAVGIVNIIIKLIDKQLTQNHDREGSYVNIRDPYSRLT